jgi:hypothetical protein
MVARATRKRMYRTMQGRMIDIEKLRASNEDVRAVGNMNVNARGDVLGPGGKIATSKEKIIKKYYEQPKGKVDSRPTRAKPMPPRKTPPAPKPVMTAKPQAKQTVKSTKPKTETKKGIEAALDGLE